MMPAIRTTTFSAGNPAMSSAEVELMDAASAQSMTNGLDARVLGGDRVEQLGPATAQDDGVAGLVQSAARARGRCPRSRRR